MTKNWLGATALLVCFNAHGIGFDDLTERLFGDHATGIEGQFKDAQFEFEAQSAVLYDASLRDDVHLVVARNRDSVLIAGQAKTEALKQRVQARVLEAANLQWSQGDIHQVEPSNAQVCGEQASKVAGNDRRRFNLKSADACSTVNRFYNQIEVKVPQSEIEKSDDDVYRATLVNQLLKSGVIEDKHTVKVVVVGQTVYLLGDQLSKATADKIIAFVEQGANGAKKVVPLFRL